jgi:hypothetical protein
MAEPELAKFFSSSNDLELCSDQLPGQPVVNAIQLFFFVAEDKAK